MQSALLKIYVSSENPELVRLYKVQIEKHNENIANDAYPNSGFDIFFPETTLFHGQTYKSTFVDFKIVCHMTVNDGQGEYPSAYFVFPRSSISKTPLSLANQTGIIDMGYLGNIIGAFRNNDTTADYVVDEYTRLLQICLPSLRPFRVEMVFDKSEFPDTTRGSGGFGSTGK